MRMAVSFASAPKNKKKTFSLSLPKCRTLGTPHFCHMSFFCASEREKDAVQVPRQNLRDELRETAADLRRGDPSVHHRQRLELGNLKGVCERNG